VIVYFCCVYLKQKQNSWKKQDEKKTPGPPDSHRRFQFQQALLDFVLKKTSILKFKPDSTLKKLA